MTSLPDDPLREVTEEGLRHWARIAKTWSHIGPPLRPVKEDTALYWKMIQRAGEGRVPRVLLLGVTPELYRLPWPKGTDFLAVDRCEEMISAVWPGSGESVLHEDWLSLTLPEGSRDIVLCDGGLHLITYPQGQQRLAQVLSHVMSDGGIFVLRLFAPSSRRELPDAVLKSLFQGEIPNVNILKLRLGMSLLENAAEGVELGKVWRAVNAVEPDLESLARRVGWPPANARAIDAYRDSAARYYFVTTGEVFDLFCKGLGEFEPFEVSVPTYDFGEQCPIVALRRRRRAREGTGKRA